jgi:hypothetical protein
VDVHPADLRHADEAGQARDMVEVVVRDGDLDRDVLVLQNAPPNELVQVPRIV